MILYKKHNIVAIAISLMLFVGCYEDPFFELTIKVQDQELNAVSGALVDIYIIDVDNGDVIETEIIGESFHDSTESNGEVSFSFENKALITARVCYSANGSESCAEGHAYLEENTNTEIRLMLQSKEINSNSCNYCDE